MLKFLQSKPLSDNQRSFRGKQAHSSRSSQKVPSSIWSHMLVFLNETLGHQGGFPPLNVVRHKSFKHCGPIYHFCSPNNEVKSHSFLQMAWEHGFRISIATNSEGILEANPTGKLFLFWPSLERRRGGKGAAVYLWTKKTKSSNLRISYSSNEDH